MTPSARTIALVVYLLAAAGVLVGVGRGKFERHGDGWEYYATLEAVDRHGTFDIRPGDREAVMDRLHERHNKLIAETDPPEATAAACGASVLLPKRIEALAVYEKELHNGFVPAPDGRLHAMHFWAFPLAAYPAKLALRAVGGWEYNALKVTNAALFLLAVGAALFRAGGGPGRRVLFALLLGVSPAVWYVTYTGAESFSWSLVTLATVALDTRRYARSALFAAVAATQNPPLVLLVAVSVGCAVLQRRWRQAGLAILGGAVAMAPVAYYLYHFGEPSLITRQHTDPKQIGVSRTLCLLFDLNVGLLPYVPVLLFGAAGGAVVLAMRRDVRAVLVALAVTGMVLGVQVQVNWNSDCRGLQRYLVWMLPPLAWLALEGWGGWWRVGLVGCHVAVTGGVLIFDPPAPWNYLEHRPLARWVMTSAPRLYNPEHEIFVERLVRAEEMPLERPPDVGPRTRVALPLAFGRTNGEVTKLLVHRESAGRLTARFTVDPAYLPELLKIAEASETPVYVHPPKRAVWATPWTIHGDIRADDQDLRPTEGPR